MRPKDQTVVASKILHSEDLQYKAYCHGRLAEDNSIVVKLSAICEDSSIEVLDEELPECLLVGVLKLMSAREVIPITLPLKSVRTFDEFARICIFPFLHFVSKLDYSGASSLASEHTGCNF